jgi:Transposase DDE domain
VSTRKGGGYYGYKVHAAVDVATELPLASSTETASTSEQTIALPLIERAHERGFGVKVAIMDGGYDTEPIHGGCMDRGVLPITPLRETPAVKRGDDKPPVCRYGVSTFAGADFKRRAAKWRLPDLRVPARERVGEGFAPAPLIPRESARSVKLYRSRGAVEREFGRLKNEWAMAPLRVRRVGARAASCGLDRVGETLLPAGRGAGCRPRSVAG